MIENKDLNRLRVLLVEKERTHKWSAGKSENVRQPYPNGVPIPHKPVWRYSYRFARLLEVDIDELVRTE